VIRAGLAQSPANVQIMDSQTVDESASSTGEGRSTRPTFIVIGAMKAGTTSLWHHLRSHPQVFMSSTKELRYFIAERNWHLGPDWYRAQFADAGNAVAVGEASPDYTLGHAFQGVPGRMADLIPDARLIYLLRDPVKRLRSHYLERLRVGDETRPPERAIRENPGYVRGSCYMWQLERFLDHYPRDQILLVTSESLRDSRSETLRSIFAFIGVDPGWDPPEISTRTNTTGEVLIRREPVEKLRGSPLYRAAAFLAPPSLRRMHHRLTTRKITTDTIDLSDALTERIIEQLRPDVAALRPLMPPGFDGWGIA
jgi:hypothetical protein